jgi:DNA recombination protein RmuC
MLYLLAGMLAGGLAGWLIRALLAKTAIVRLEVGVESAQRQQAAQSSELTTARVEQRQALESLRQESSRRAAAEQLAARVPALESRLTQREQALAEQQAKAAELETRLADERKASAEKLALLDEAQQKLSDAFKALSSDALARNNQAFLDLAKATLEKFQEGARTDEGIEPVERTVRRLQAPEMALVPAAEEGA